jgi:ribosome-binding protein aMBF1 (putative translation factor)
VEVIRDAFADALEEERLRVIRGLEARGITSKLCDSTVENILVEMARDEAQLHVCDRMAEIGAATTTQRMSRRTIQLKK